MIAEGSVEQNAERKASRAPSSPWSMSLLVLLDERN